MGNYFEDYFMKVKQAASWFKSKVKINPKLMIVLTGGIDGPEDEIEDKVVVRAFDVPNFPTARAEGHEGKLIFGMLDDEPVVLLKGRYHSYEGHLPQEVVFPYFVMCELGVKSLITTNAVGGIRDDLNAGDIMLITDHINAMGDNPLKGVAIQRSENQFTDMTSAYCPESFEIVRCEASRLGIHLKEGVYLATSGPNYETKTEIKMFRSWGADAVGMSTVFEVIACNFLKIDVLAFSCIANPAADRHEGEMGHAEVLAAMKAAGPKLSSLVSACARKILSRN